jgi:hypothetical protein
MLQANDAGRILLREGWQRLVPELSAVEQVWEGFGECRKAGPATSSGFKRKQLEASSNRLQQSHLDQQQSLQLA